MQAAVLLPLFGFCALMWRWERAAVVASRFTGAADGRPEAAAAATARCSLIGEDQGAWVPPEAGRNLTHRSGSTASQAT